MFKRDSLRLGLVLGFFAPMIGVIIFYFWKASNSKFLDFLEVALQNKQFLTMLISVSLFANAVIFTLYINSRKDRTAKGIFISTCVYAVVALAIKFFR